mgnify:CR=1 FL=1
MVRYPEQDFFNNLFHSSGIVSGPNGNILYTNGTTYTVSHTGGSGTYVITFSTAHPKSTYPILVTPQTGSSNTAVPGTISANGFTVKTFITNTGGLSDCQFSFLVLL